MSDLWTNIDPDIYSIDVGSSNKGIKDQENLEDQEQEPVLLVPRMNPRRLRQGNQRTIRQIYIEI